MIFCLLTSGFPSRNGLSAFKMHFNTFVIIQMNGTSNLYRFDKKKMIVKIGEIQCLVLCSGQQ